MAIINKNEFFTAISNLVFTAFNTEQISTTGMMSTLVNTTRQGQNINTDNYLYRTANLLTEYDFDTRVTAGDTLLTQYKPRIYEQQVLLNERKFIPLTLEEFMGGAGFTSSMGIGGFIAYILSRITQTFEAEMYKRNVDKIVRWSPVKPTQSIDIPLVDISATTDIVEKSAGLTYNSNEIFKVIKKLSVEMQSPNFKYNDITTEDLYAYGGEGYVIYMNSKYYTDILVDSLIKQFNSQMMQFPFTIVEIPESYFAPISPKSICIIADSKKIGTWYRNQASTSFFNAFNMTTNHYLHYSFGVDTLKALVGVRLYETTLV